VGAACQNAVLFYASEQPQVGPPLEGNFIYIHNENLKKSQLISLGSGVELSVTFHILDRYRYRIDIDIDVDADVDSDIDLDIDIYIHIHI